MEIASVVYPKPHCSALMSFGLWDVVHVKLEQSLTRLWLLPFIGQQGSRYSNSNVASDEDDENMNGSLPIL